jgi:hypothetical protein
MFGTFSVSEFELKQIQELGLNSIPNSNRVPSQQNRAHPTLIFPSIRGDLTNEKHHSTHNNSTISL